MSRSARVRISHACRLTPSCSRRLYMTRLVYKTNKHHNQTDNSWTIQNVFADKKQSENAMKYIRRKTTKLTSMSESNGWQVSGGEKDTELTERYKVHQRSQEPHQYRLTPVLSVKTGNICVTVALVRWTAELHCVNNQTVEFTDGSLRHSNLLGLS